LNTAIGTKLNKALADGKVFIGDASNEAAAQTISGDVSITNAGVATVAKAPLLKKAFVAGESFAANTSFAVRFAISGETAGRVYKCDKDASTSKKYMAIGIALATSAISAGDSIDVVLLGHHAQGSSDSAFDSADVGKELFVGTSGAIILAASLADTTNEAQFCLGVVESTTSIHVDFKQLRGIA
jgi:hypothetical protein